MSTNDSPRPIGPPRAAPTPDELFEASEPIRKAENLARSGIFEDDDVDQFLADLYAVRRSDVA